MGWKSRRIVRGPGEREREKKKTTSSKGVEGKIITICKKMGGELKSEEDLSKTLHLHKGFHKCSMHTFIYTCAYKCSNYYQS